MVRSPDIHPRETLKEEYSDPREISTYRLSGEINIPPARTSRFKRGKGRICPPAALIQCRALTAVILIAILTAAGPLAARAQETGPGGDADGEEGEPALGILTKGPEYRRGISVLYPNAIPCFYGEYAYEDRTVRVFYTEEPIAVRDSWESYPCPGLSLVGLPERRDLVLYYEDDRGWKVFFVFPPQADEDSPCRFIDVFLARLTYFLGITGEEQIVPLPAVLRFQ